MLLGILGVARSLVLIPATRATVKRVFDYWGFVFTAVTCFGLMFGLDLLSRQVAPRALAYLYLVGSVVTGALAVRHALRKEEPLVELWAFRLPSFSVAIQSGALSRLAIGAIPFLLPLLFQIGFKLNAFSCGLLVLCVFAGNLGMKPFTTPMLRRFGFRTTLLVSGLINSGAIVACAYLSPTVPWVVIAALLLVNGLTRSTLFTALNTLAFANVPQARMSGANTVFNMMQRMTMGIGAVCGALALRIAAFLTRALRAAYRWPISGLRLF